MRFELSDSRAQTKVVEQDKTLRSWEDEFRRLREEASKVKLEHLQQVATLKQEIANLEHVRTALGERLERCDKQLKETSDVSVLHSVVLTC